MANSNYVPSSGDAKIIERVENMFAISEQSKKPLHRQFRESEALYFDQHWSMEGMPNNQNQIQMNLIASAIDTIIPILSARPPKIDVLPSSVAEEDAQVAKIMQAQMDDLWELRDMQNVIPEFLLDYLVYGTGILKVHWGNNDLPDCDVVDPFNFYVNPMATSLEDAQWVMYCAPVNVYEIREKYPNGKYVKAQSNLDSYEAMKMFQDYSGSTIMPNPDGSSTRYPSKSSASEALEERALLIECWWRDGTKDYVPEELNGEATGSMMEFKKYPGTRLTTIANGVMLYDGKSPYPFFNHEHNLIHPFPFVSAKNSGSAHSFWGRPEPKRLKTINLSMDKVASQIMDNINLMANPMWVVDETAGIKEQITNRPGSIITKAGVGSVDMKQPAGIPNYVFNFFSLMENMFETISGVNKATQGKEAPNVTSGVQAEVYRKSSTTKIDFKSRMIDACIQQLGAQWLAMIQNLGSEEHRMTVTEELGDVEYGYTGVQLRGKNMRVRSKPGSMLPDNKTYIEEKVMALAQMGIITDPEFIIDNVELPNKQVLINKIQEQKRIQQEAEMQVQQEDEALEGQLQSSEDEDEIMGILQSRPDLAQKYM